MYNKHNWFYVSRILSIRVIWKIDCETMAHMKFTINYNALSLWQNYIGRIEELKFDLHKMNYKNMLNGGMDPFRHAFNFFLG